MVMVFMVGECSGHRRGLKRFDQGGWPAQDPSGLGPDLGGWPSRKVRPHHVFATQLPSHGNVPRRIKKNAFQQNYQHSIGRPSSSFVSFRVPPGTFPTGSYSTNWALKRHVDVEQGVQGRPGGANSYWNSHSKRQTDLPSTQRQAQPGCLTSGGFRSPGSSWQMPGCARGVCAVTLQGGWQPTEERCEGLVQNPQYQVQTQNAWKRHPIFFSSV